MEATLYTSVYSVAAVTLVWLVWEFVGGALELWDSCGDSLPNEDSVEEVKDDLYYGFKKLLDEFPVVTETYTKEESQPESEINPWEEELTEEESYNLDVFYRNYLLKQDREFLRQQCRELGVKNYGVMTKTQMIDALVPNLQGVKE